MAFMDRKIETSSPVAAATDAIIAAICSFSRVPVTQMMLIFDICFYLTLWKFMFGSMSATVDPINRDAS
jgi:FtsH-binding integral membrane protein